MLVVFFLGVLTGCACPLDLVLDDIMGDNRLVVFLWVEEHAKSPSQTLSFFLSQVTASDHVLYNLNLLCLNSEEEESQRNIETHDVFEQHCLARLKLFDELRHFLDELEDCLILFLLLSEGLSVSF